MAGEPEPAQAAVLVPVIARAVPAILFTRRADALSRHSGQVSFPGGLRAAADRTPVETALRETMEETGIAPAHVRMAGFLTPQRTSTGFDIVPVVGVVMPGFVLAPNPSEVAEVFEVPLAFFLDPANRGLGRRAADGRMGEYPLFEPAGHLVWGVTARLLVDFAARLGRFAGAEGSMAPGDDGTSQDRGAA